MVAKVLLAACVMLTSTFVFTRPLWYLPSLWSNSLNSVVPVEDIEHANKVLRERLRTIEPEHFDLFVSESDGGSAPVLALKELLEDAGWSCDQFESSSTDDVYLEIEAPAESQTANIIYDWARSVGYRPRFVIEQGKLTIRTGNRHNFPATGEN